jgi:hypothetical protein
LGKPLQYRAQFDRHASQCRFFTVRADGRDWASGHLESTGPDDAKAEAAYGNIMSTGSRDIVSVAKNTGFSEDEIRIIKNHIFFDEHAIPIIENGKVTIVKGQFSPDINLAEAWLAARSGKLSDTQLDYVKQLFAHEHKEALLEAQGLPHRDPKMTIPDGNSEKYLKGNSAHDNAPPPPKGYFTDR